MWYIQKKSKIHTSSTKLAHIDNKTINKNWWVGWISVVIFWLSLLWLYSQDSFFVPQLAIFIFFPKRFYRAICSVLISRSTTINPSKRKIYVVSTFIQHYKLSAEQWPCWTPIALFKSSPTVVPTGNPGSTPTNNQTKVSILWQT